MRAGACEGVPAQCMHGLKEGQEAYPYLSSDSPPPPLPPSLPPVHACACVYAMYVQAGKGKGGRYAGYRQTHLRLLQDAPGWSTHCTCRQVAW